MPQKDPGPSVRDKELYEKLCGEGNSKEKSDRIANAAANSSRSEIGHHGGQSSSYDDWTVEELRDRAAQIRSASRAALP